MKYIRRAYFIELLFIFITSLLPLHWLSGSQMLLGHDSGFRLMPVVNLKNLFYSWNPIVNFGIDWALYKAFLVTQFPETLFSVLTGSILWGQRIALVLWFFLIGFGMWLGIYLVFPQKQYRFLRLWSSAFAMYNFYILQGWFIAERAEFSLFAALPIAVALLYRTIIRKKNIVRHAIAFGLLYFILNGGGSPPLYGATLVGLVCSFIIFSIIAIRKDGRGVLKRLCFIACGMSVSFLTVNAYWVLPQLSLYLGTYSQTVGAYGGIEGLIAWEGVISKNASIINLLRLQGIPDWYDNVYNPFAHQFLTNHLLIIASFIPAIIVFVGSIFLLWKRKNIRQIWFLVCLYILLLIGLVLAAGSHPPFGVAFIWAMRHVPGFAIFRSSFYKFAPLVWIPMIILSGFMLNSVLQSIKGRLVQALIAAGFITGLFVYHYPFFVSDIFQFSKDFTTRVSVPPYVTDTAKVMNSADPYSGNILIYPPLDAGFINQPIDTYRWGFYSLDVLPRLISTVPIIANDATGTGGELVNRMYEALDSHDRRSFFNLASILRVRSILVRRDVQFSKPQPAPDFVPIATAFGLTKTFDKGEWQLWDLPGSAPPIVQAAGAVTDFQGDLSASGSDIVGVEPAVPVVEIGDGTGAGPATSLATSIVYGGECYFCKTAEWNKYVSGITILRPRILPGSVAYPYITWKEERENNNAKTGSAKIDVLIAHAQTRLGEYMEFRTENNIARLQSAQARYELAMNDAVKIMDNLSGRDKTVYANRILAYFLAQQRELGKDPEFESYFQTMIVRVQPLVWMGDGQQEYRYGLTVDTDANYQLLVYDVSSQTLKLDGSLVTNPKNVYLTAGFHTVELTAAADNVPRQQPAVYAHRNHESINISSPAVTFIQKNPTNVTVHINNAQKAFLLLYNAGFDARWKIKINGETLQESRHVLTNGFANGWIIDTKGTYDATIYYQPQSIFYIGAVITIAGFVCVAIILTVRKDQQRIHRV